MQNEPGPSALTWDAWWDDHYRTDLTFSRTDLHTLHQFSFLSTARDPQRPPKGDWRTWLFIGGRGAGKTRAGAEWVRFAALHGQCERIALIGPTLGDVREVMIEGPSGLRSIEPLDAFRPEFNVSRRRLEWPNGALAFAFSAEDPDSLRGPQFDAAWSDEIAVWPDGETVWSNLQFGLRLGEVALVIGGTRRTLSAAVHGEYRRCRRHKKAARLKSPGDRAARAIPRRVTC
jgi:phage terminase large subunit-like protein